MGFTLDLQERSKVLLDKLFGEWSDHLSFDAVEYLRSTHDRIKLLIDSELFNSGLEVDNPDSELRVLDSELEAVRDYSVYHLLQDALEPAIETLEDEERYIVDICIDVLDLMLDLWYKFKYNYNLEEFICALRETASGIFRPNFFNEEELAAD